MSITIAVDAMGGDNAPEATVKGAALAAIELGVHILLVGRQDAIETELAKVNAPAGALSVLHAPDVIETHEVPTTAIRRKKESSLIVGLKAVKEGQAAAFVSAGSTGALLTGATVFIGRSEGIERPALGALLPNRNSFTFLVDCGANVDCKPAYLAQFAQMGSAYMTKARGIKNPRVGLINIGAEAEKGNALVKEAYGLLEEAAKQYGFNFIGNVEARDVPLGAVDVAVCDAFVGNVVLKYTEGLAKGLMGMVKDELMADPVSKIGALLAKGAFGRIKKRLDYDDIGGAPFLGLKNLVVKAHGSSNERAICGAIRQCVLFNEAGTIN
ncbi:MAG: phosphate acyltransferase PlsX [Defluviitaleaceae bacterium]|nr:phosphate acyltransferase PlsX [Defluviitaleaceae bacterium]